MNFERTRQIGELTITLPDPPPKNQIANYDLPKEDQMFQKTYIPDDLQYKSETERNEIISREWDRRKNGYWFYNNGNIEYVTGVHYFYLNYWRFPVFDKKLKKKILGTPNFVDSDRDFFYAWDHCVEDPNCYGLIYITNRRDGKTYRGTCILYEAISRTPEAIGGIQSKNTTDGKKVFNKLIKGWQKTPDFFKPIDTGESHPSSALKFYEPSRKDTKNIKKDYTQVLRSEVNYGSAKEEHYDGDDLFRYYMDEAGKTLESEAKVDDRWFIVRETMSEGSNVTGKAIITTTVEDMEKKGGKRCKNIWDASDPSERDALNRTESGLYRLFKPSDYGFRGEDENESFVDKYGYSSTAKAREYFEKRRAALKGHTLISERRKYPLEVHDCWLVENKESPFDLSRINMQIDYNYSLPKSTVIRGNFYWVEKDVKVGWKPSPDGRWNVSWMPSGPYVNNVTTRSGRKAPGNDDIVSGVDPFDHKSTTDNRKSHAASHVLRKHDPFNPLETGIFVSEYLARPPTPEMFYEDMVMQCFFYGCEILPETNKPGLANYFRTRGYYSFLMKRPEPTHNKTSRRGQMEPGIPMTPPTIEALISKIVTFVYEHVGHDEENDCYHKMYFNRTLEDIADCDVNNLTPHDLTVSAGITLLASHKYVSESKKNRTERKPLYRVYDIKGTRSKRLG